LITSITAISSEGESKAGYQEQKSKARNDPPLPPFANRNDLGVDQNADHSGENENEQNA